MRNLCKLVLTERSPIDSINHWAANWISRTGAMAAGSDHSESSVTEIQAASLNRIEIEPLCTRYWIGPPNGARRMTWTTAPGTNPISISRDAILLAPEIAVTIADDPGDKSASRNVFTRAQPQKEVEHSPELKPNSQNALILRCRHNLHTTFRRLPSWPLLSKVRLNLNSPVECYRSSGGLGHTLCTRFRQIPANFRTREAMRAALKLDFARKHLPTLELR